MKKFLFLLFVFSFFGRVTGQELIGEPVEIFFITDGIPSSPVVTLTLTNQSQCYSTDFRSGVQQTVPQYGDFYQTSEFNNPIYEPSENNLGVGDSGGFDFVVSPSGTYPIYTWGLYKVTNNINDDYFYIDFRDYRFGFYSYYDPPFNGSEIDIHILFNAGSFYYWDYSSPVSYQNISRGEVLRIWEIKQKGNPQTYLFPNFWSNALAVVNNGSGNPKLVWSAYPTSNLVVKSYRVYRAVPPNTYPPPTPNYSLLKTVSSSTFEYTDIDYALGGNLGLHYKVTAMVEDIELRTITETAASNIVVVGGGFYKRGNTTEKNETVRFLNNYPNPFNPKTNISFQLTKSTHVVLSVYDVLGNLVSKLVDDNKNEGMHQVSFDGSSISSGVYFIVLSTDSKIISKKMLLSK